MNQSANQTTSLTSNLRFQGKTVLITGGNSGMGFTTAKRIVQEGGSVIITGRDQAKLDVAQKELGPNATAIQSDTSNLKQIENLMEQIKAKFGKIDGVFANAGVAVFNAVEAVTEEEFDNLFNINVKGVFFTLQKSIPVLNDHAALVINASVVASKGGPHNSVYAASKAAVRNMARTFSSSLVDRGIRVNAISPGPIATPIWAGMPKEMTDAVAMGNPMKRYGTMDEITSAITFLLSPESTYIVGAELLVDGGYTQL